MNRQKSKETEITPQDFDCPKVRNERRKLYREMAEHFGGDWSDGFIHAPGICDQLLMTYKLIDDNLDKEEMFDKFPELAWLEPSEERLYWFETTPEGQQERSTALLFVCEAMK